MAYSRDYKKAWKVGYTWGIRANETITSEQAWRLFLKYLKGGKRTKL